MEDGNRHPADGLYHSFRATRPISPTTSPIDSFSRLTATLFQRKPQERPTSTHYVSPLEFLHRHQQKLVVHVANLHLYDAWLPPSMFSLFPIWMLWDQVSLLDWNCHFMSALESLLKHAFRLQLIGIRYRDIECRLVSKLWFIFRHNVPL